MPRPKKDVVKVTINLERIIKDQFDKTHYDGITGKVSYGKLSDVVNRLLIKYLKEVKHLDLDDLIGDENE